jgi:DNA-binding FadR family transcriptional regulator
MKNSIDDEAAWVEMELDFHMSIVQAVGNPLLEALMDTITHLLREVFELFYSGPREGRSEGLRAHRDILGALAAHDAEAARQAMYHHLERSQTVVLERWQETQ